MPSPGLRFARAALLTCCFALASSAFAAPLEPVRSLAVLKAMNFRDYGQITVLINGDEEVSSAGSRTMLSKLGSEHDVVFSFESSRVESDRLSLTTAGIAAVLLNVQGKASHAGSAPERGRNALYELAHQILQMRDLSNPETGVKMNWTIASAGT